MSAGRSVAVVTGGAGSIGLACARRLASHRVLLAGPGAPRLEEAAERLRSEGVEAAVQVCDVSDAASVSELAATAAAMGPIAALVHAAGLSAARAGARRMLEVNLRGTLLVLDEFERLVTESSVGVMIASIGGHRRFARHYDQLLASCSASDVMPRLTAAGVLDLDPRAVYAISKRGVIVQAESRACAWGRRGGRLVSISPGFVGDSTMASLVSDASSYVSQSALGRSGTTREIAGAVALMCSSEASYISGVDLLVDGGTRAGTNWTSDADFGLRWHGPQMTT